MKLNFVVESEVSVCCPTVRHNGWGLEKVGLETVYYRNITDNDTMFFRHLQSENKLLSRERPLLQMPKPNARIFFELLLYLRAKSIYLLIANAVSS